MYQKQFLWEHLKFAPFLCPRRLIDAMTAFAFLSLSES